MPDPSDLPLAVRRTRRSSAAPRAASPSQATASPSSNPPSATTSTPNKRTNPRPKKRVRFSDPGPSTASPSSHQPDDDELALSTGLTPTIRRTSLSRKPRRHSTPARPAYNSGSGVASSALSGIMYILPLSQVLDGRVQRRIRRNGLSEEMNNITAERRRRVREGQEEIERLKREVQEKDEEIARLREQELDPDDTIVGDGDRVWELQQQVQTLRRQLEEREGHSPARDSGRNNAGLMDSSPTFANWTAVARDPFSDSVYMDVDDMPVLDAGNDADDEELGLVEADFGDATMAELACSTPSRRRGQSGGRASFPTPPTTSPAAVSFRLRTPSRMAREFVPENRDSGVQADMPNEEKAVMEEEIASLHLETAKLTATLEGYVAITERMAGKLAACEPLDTDTSSSSSATSPHADLEARLATLLRTVSDRTAALLHLNSSLSDLGFAGSDAAEIVTSLRSAFRSARLELEYLSPGECTLPLTAAGSAVLDVLLSRLRDLSKRAREADEHIDEYHEIEGRLRKQLGARVDAMEKLGSEVRERDEKILELETGVERLKGAVRTYARDVRELEGLVGRLEGEMEEKSVVQGQIVGEKNKQLADMSAAGAQKDAQLIDKTAVVGVLEEKLKEAVEQTEALRQEMGAVQAAHATALEELRNAHKTDMSDLNTAHGRALALRDARVGELREEIDRVNTALRAAHDTIQQLRVENAQLRDENVELKAKMEGDKKRAREAMDQMKAELERVARMSEGFLATPKKGKVALKKVVRFSGVEERRDSALDGEEDELVGDGEDLGSRSLSPKMGGFMAAGLAKKGPGRKRRRYDSGLGFLDEDGNSAGDEECEMF